MSRRLVFEDNSVVGTVDSILSELVSSYGNAKNELDEVKAECDVLNKKIKETMQENDIKEFSADGFKVKYVVSEKETMNEAQLLEIMSTKHKDVSDNFGFIKTRPYIDFDAIEKEIYNGNVSDELLKDIGKCKETKEVVSIRLSKEK